VVASGVVPAGHFVGLGRVLKNKSWVSGGALMLGSAANSDSIYPGLTCRPNFHLMVKLAPLSLQGQLACRRFDHETVPDV
jgi:hypothetical protein